MRVLFTSRKGAAFVLTVGLVVVVGLASKVVGLSDHALSTTIDGLTWALGLYATGNTVSKLTGRAGGAKPSAREAPQP